MLGESHNFLGINQAQGYHFFFLCSAQLILKFILLIKVKMPTIVGNIYEQDKLLALMVFIKISLNFGYFSIYKELKFHAQLS